jgi:hypothetical protein
MAGQKKVKDLFIDVKLPVASRRLAAMMRLMIEKMGAEFDRDAIQRLEGMSQQQQFALGVHRATVDTAAQPGCPDFGAPVRCLGVNERGHAGNRTAGGCR